MIRFSRILIELIVQLIIIFIGFIIGFVIEEKFDSILGYLPIIVFSFTFHIWFKRKKRIGKYLKKEFKTLGFEILTERALKFSEMPFEITPVIITINNIPLSRYGYISKIDRVFTVKTEDDKIYELNTEITKLWSGENDIEIRKKKRIKKSSIEK